MANTNDPKNILVCIPAYNESKTIGKIVKAAKHFATSVIVFDDGSTDNTAEISESNGATVIRNGKNMGYGVAIRRIFEIARERAADIMVTIDSDGQHDVYQVPRLIEQITGQGYDIVIGSRFMRKEDSDKIPKYRKFGIRTITQATRLISYSNITDAQSGFRAYNKLALSKIISYDRGMAVSTEILIRAKEEGLKIIEVPITTYYNVENSSTNNPFAHGLGVLSSVIQFITFRNPLLFYVVPGIILLLIAGIFTSHALELYSATKYISTNLILVSTGASLVGVVCLAAGAIIYTLTSLIDKKKQSKWPYSVIQFITFRNPLLFYVVPGIILLLIAGIFTSHALELYSATKYISTNLILVSTGAALVGVVCLAAGAIIYTLTVLLRGKLHS